MILDRTECGKECMWPTQISLLRIHNWLKYFGTKAWLLLLFRTTLRGNIEYPWHNSWTVEAHCISNMQDWIYLCSAVEFYAWIVANSLLGEFKLSNNVLPFLCIKMQGKDRSYVKYVAEQLGLDGSYVPRTYIEQIQLEKLVNDVMVRLS